MPHTLDDDASIEPLYATIRATSKLTSFSDVTIYRMIADHKLRAVKAGRKTLVEVASIHEYLRALPRFVGRTGASRKAA